MGKDDDIFDEKIGDGEDFLDLDLSDLSTDGVDKKPVAGESDGDIIDLVELVEKGDASEEGEEDLLQLLEDDEPKLENEASQAPKTDTVDDAEAKKMRRLAKTIPEVDFPGSDADENETEGITTTLTDIDLSEIIDDQDLSIEGDDEVEDEIDENAISLEDFDKTLEDMPAPKMPPPKPRESTQELSVEGDQGEPLEVDLLKPEDEIVQEDISVEDMEKIIEEESIEGLDFELDTSPEEDDSSIEPFGDLEMEEAVQGIDLELESSDAIEESPFIETGQEEPAEEIDLDLIEEAVPTTSEVPEEVSMPEPQPEPVQAEAAPIGISEEKVEEIISRVVQDTVERVAKETISELFAQDTIERIARESMKEVAEKVISEAIDALKQSLETVKE